MPTRDDIAPPPKLSIPNAETQAAMLRAREIERGQFATFDALMHDIERVPPTRDE